MLRFVLGKSGCGKTTLIYKKICELVESGNDKIIIIVPDQSSFETEKAFLNLLGAKQTKKVLVFGFTRLCSYVFEKTRNFSKNIIDSGTRAVFMSLTLEALTEKLEILNSRHAKSITDVMLKTVTDLKKSAVSSDMLRKCSQSVEDTTLKAKIYETALVADTFDALVNQSYIDPADDLTRLYNILLENNIFDGYTLFFDEFSGFTAQQLKVIRLLINSCEDTYFSLTLDPLTDGREDVFATSQQTYKILLDFAKKDGINIKAPIKVLEPHRFKSTELSLLECGIFRNDYEKHMQACENISIYSAADIYNECEFVARQIKKLIIHNGYRYSDISVICNDTSPYIGILDEILNKYDIPYFMDEKTDVEVKPVIRLVCSIFRVVLDDFEREDVMSLLKTGLTSNSVDDICIFENYIFVWNINKSGFKSEFTQNPSGFSESFTETDKHTLSAAEKVRSTIYKPLLKFREYSKEKNGKEITEMLYNLLLELGVPDALRKMYDSFESSDKKNTGAEQIRIWNMFVENLDKMVAIVGDRQISLKRYYELLCMQISAMKLSTIPQTIDSITVTTAQRVRVSKQKASFLIGCTEGIFPGVPHSTGIFSQYELKQLAINDISLGDDYINFTNLEIFMAYCCMTSSSEKLFISYPRLDSQGNSYSPSAIITEVLKLFPNTLYLDDFDFDSHADAMLAIKPAFEEFSKSLGKNDKGLKGLSDYFENDENYKNALEAVKRAKDNSPFEIKDKQTVESLFGENLKISASQIEKFNMCRFSYFCNYGLNIRERRKAEINPMEYGTLIHYILEKFFTKYSKLEYSTMNENDISKFIDDILNSYLSTYFGGEESKSGAFMYKLEVLKSNVKTLLLHIVEEMSQSDFNVADCELKIGTDIPSYTIKLSDNHNVAVYGSVDRVDIMEKNGVKYLRVIDYKTGPKKFKLSDILYGLNLQMLLYLCSIQKNGTEKYGEIIPSAILYMPASVPSVTAEIYTDNDKLNSKIVKELSMNGLLVNDINIIRGMDKSDMGKYIPVKIKLDTPVSARSLVILEDFGKIFNKIDNIIATMGTDLYSGNIKASPVKGAHDGCMYCPYDSVCAYHKSEPVNTFDVDNDEVMRQIADELSEAEGGI